MDPLQINLKGVNTEEELKSRLGGELDKQTEFSEKQKNELVSEISDKVLKIRKEVNEKQAENTVTTGLEGLSQELGKDNVPEATNVNNGSDANVNNGSDANVNNGNNNVNSGSNTNVNINDTKTETITVDDNYGVIAPVNATINVVNNHHKQGDSNIYITIEQPATPAPEAPKPTVTPAPEAPKPTVPDYLTQKTTINNAVDVHTLDGFLISLDKLLQEIKDIREGISKKGLSKESKKRMDMANSTLKIWEDRLKNKKKILLKQKSKVVYDEDVNNLNEIRSKTEKMKEGLFGKGQWDESWNPELSYGSIKEAKKSNKYQVDMAKLEQELQKELKNGAILNIFNGNMQAATDFYRRIAQGEYTQADYGLFMTNPGVFTPSFQNCGIQVPVWPRYNQRELREEERTSGASCGLVDYGNMSLGSAFERGGLSGLIGKALDNCTNMTPGQRNTWRSLAVLGGYAALGVGLFKFFTNKKMSFWGKALATGGVIFASQALTGEGPFSLINKVMTGGFSRDKLTSKIQNAFGNTDDLNSKFGNNFGNAVNGIGNAGLEYSGTIAPAMCSMMVFNPQTTVGNINTMTQQFRSDPNSRTVFRGEAINKLKNKYGQQGSEYFSATFSDKFDEEKRNNWLASFGVTDASRASKANVSIYELANNATMNEVIIEKYRTEHGVKETSNSVKKKEFEEYVKNLKTRNQPIDVDELERHPEWFELDKEATYTERAVDNQFKHTILNQVESLGIAEPKKQEFQTAIKRFYDERTIDSKPLVGDFSLSNENGLLVLTSHSGQKTKIDVDKNEIIGFGNGIRFADLSELLDAADLTNKVLESQKGKVAVDYPPFKYKREAKGIYFNNAKGIWDDIISFSYSGTDTRVLSTGPWGLSKKIDTLDNHLEEYAEYLSKRWMEINKPTSQ